MADEELMIRAEMRGARETQANLDKTAASVRGVGAATRDANGRLRDANGRFVQMDKSSRGAAGGLGKTSMAMKMTSRASRGLSMNMTLVKLAALGAAAATLKVGMDFEAGMDKVEAVTGASAGQMKDLSNLALDLGQKTKFSAKEASEAMYELGSAGFKANQMAGALPGTLAVAAASGIELKDAAEITSNALNGFGLKATESQRVADVFARAVADSSLEMGDLQYSMKYIGPIAAASGQSLETMTAALEIMAQAGIKGEQAGTTLRGGMTRLIKPTKMVKEGMADLGLSMADLQDGKGRMKQLPEIMDLIRKKSKGMTQMQRNAAMAQVFGTEALSGYTALLNAAPGTYQKNITSLQKSKDAAQDMATTMQGNTKNAVEQLGGAVETAQIKFYLWANQSDRLKKFVEGVTAAVNRLTNRAPALFAAINAGDISGAGKQFQYITHSSDGVRKAFEKVLKFGRALGTTFKTVLMPAASDLLGMMGDLTTPLDLVTGGLKLINKHSGLAKTAVKALVIGFVAYKAALMAAKAAQVIWTATLVATRVATIAYAVLLHPIAVATNLWQLAMWALNAAFLANPVGVIIIGIIALAAVLVLAYKKVGWFRAAVNAVFAFVKDHWQLIGTLLFGPIFFAVSMIIKHWNKVIGFIKGSFNLLKNFFVNLKNGDFKKAFTGLFDGLKDAFKTVYNWLVDKWNSLEFGMDAVKVKGKTVVPGFHVGTPNLPKLAKGGVADQAGWAMVGERGPELRYLPRGASVHPLPMRATMADRTHSAIEPLTEDQIGANVVSIAKVFLDRRQIAEAVADEYSHQKARA